MQTVPFLSVVENDFLVGVIEGVNPLKDKFLVWNKIWDEAGCPSTGVLSQLKKHAKTRYKYPVRRLKVIY